MFMYRVEHFWAGGFFSGKINKAEVETRLNELATLGWEVISSTFANRFFGETHNIIYTLRKEN
jgi:hypothetical protein